MLRNRLLAATAAFALATGQVSSGWAALPSPLIQTAPANDNSPTAANTAWVGSAISGAIASLQSTTVGLLGGKLSHVANMAGVAGWTITSVPLEVDGTVVAGDGGRRRMTFDPTNLCSAAGHPAADGFTCVNSTALGAGSWNIDWSSVPRREATPALFENATSATDDTAAIRAAIATGQHVYLPYIGRSYVVSSDVAQSMSGQVIEADSRIEAGGTDSPTIFVNATGGFTKGVFVSTAAEPGPTYRNLSILFAQPDPGTGANAYQNLRQYVPAFISQNVSRTRYEKVGCYLAWSCIDQRGAGGWYIDDMQMSSFSPSGAILIDAALDTVRIHNLHSWVFSETANMQAINGAVGASYRPLALNIGRVDGLYVDDSLFYIALGAYIQPGSFGNAQQGSLGNGFGSFTNCDFDTYGGVYQSAGDWHYLGDDFTMGVAGAIGFQEVSGATNNATMSASRFFKGAATGTPMMTSSGGAFNGSALSFNAVSFDDAAIVSQTGGTLNMTDVQYLRTPGIAYAKPSVSVTGGRASLTFMGQTDAGSGGSGTFISIGATNGHTVVGNTGFGYTYSLPTATATEYYAGNR